MTHLNRGPVLLVLLVAVILTLAACGSVASSSSVARTPTGTAAALVKGEFVGDAGRLAGIALSTDGRQVIAYLCDGDAHQLNLAEWFKGPVTGTGIDITNAHGAHLVATVSARAIRGTVTLKDGRSAPFAARLLPAPGRDNYGLFRSEETFHGVRYLGGWIFNPPHFADFRTGTGAQASGVYLDRVMVPMPVCCAPDDRGAGIINEQTGALIKSPPVDGESVTVPGLGTFRLTPCREAQC
jgi:hypothetical protein